MKCNVGRTDQALRIVLGIIVLVLSYFLLAGWLAIVGYVVGVVMLVTGIFRFCPMYLLGKINTNGK